MNNDKILKTAKYLVELLVEKKYDILESLSQGKRLSKQEIEIAINEYPATFIMPVDIQLEELDIIPISNSSPTAYSVDINLWTKEEGRSDLTLQTTMVESNGKMMEIEIDDIHVL